jgi:excisionase family DNA binding protein
VSPLEPKAVNIAQAAELLGVHPHTVNALIDQGQLYAVKVGRRYLIPVAEVERFLEPQSV